MNKNFQFKNGHNLFKNNNISKILQDFIDDIFAFEFYNSQIHSNFRNFRVNIYF